MLKAIAQAQKGSIAQSIVRLSKMFTRASFEIIFDGVSGKTKIAASIMNLSFEDAMEDIFKVLFKMSEEKGVVLIIDEFQQISKIKDVKIDAIMRKYMQTKMDISYIFLGSKRHTLTELFKYKAPLYEMATHFELEGIDTNNYIEYIQKHLRINDDLILYIIDKARFETKLIQHICHILYIVHKKKEITKDFIDETLREIILSKDTAYSMIYDNLTLNKKKAFKIVANYVDFYKKDILEEYKLSKQALLSAFNALYKDEIIDKKDSWFIPDRTLELWGILKFGK
ncbi:MAG: hypothetical protein Q9M43_02975 [Sulfurimonas sp.]|nr:hypothetical protein [Sulfurimonas sp.]